LFHDAGMRLLALFSLSVAICGCTYNAQDPKPQTPAAHPVREGAAPLHDPRETHLRNIRQLTFSGENAEGYFDSQGKRLVFQASKGETGYKCDQIFELDLASGAKRLVSTGTGRTTCAYFIDGDRRIVYASTHLAGPKCPPEPDRSHGYVWALYPDYDIFSVPTGGGDLVRLTSTPGYDAEATWCEANQRLIFTSARDGDLELYSMKDDGSDVRRLTNHIGYDGGAFYSRDGKQIVWRASRPATEAAKSDFRALLAQGLVKPTVMELWVADADGSNARQITNNGKANWAPYFFPDGKRVIFSSNMGGSTREFHLYVVDIESKKIERVTYSSRFNAFPIFSPDGKRIVFGSNRHNRKEGDTNLFIADWVE